MNAEIQKREGKNGVSFYINVYVGIGLDGKKRYERTTWRPEKGMTARQMEKAAQKFADQFIQQIERGYQVSNDKTFAEYADYVLSLKLRSGTTKLTTYEHDKALLIRINAAIGHLKLTEIRPHHLNQFYQNLSEDGMRLDNEKSVAKLDLRAYIKSRGLTRQAVADKAGIAPSTMTAAMDGHAVLNSKAYAICEALGDPYNRIFAPIQNDGKLSAKFIMAHHTVISSVLSQAEKEMIVPYNAAQKATPPALVKHDPNYFQPEVIADILDALDTEPLKWQAIINLLIVTGCRRGEIIGLQWEKIDFENALVKIDKSLVRTKEKGAILTSTKTSDTRLLHIPPETVQLLKRYRVEQMQLRLMSGDRWHNTGFVFTGDTGDPMRPDSMTQWLRDFSERHGLPHINPHAFRHTVASVLIANGTDVVTVSKQLGHASVTTTESFYAHIIDQKKAEATECIANIMLRRHKA